MTGWQKFCNNCSGSCVEFYEIAGEIGETVIVRNSDDPNGPKILFTKHELDEFAKGWNEKRRS
jgi:hypothetical protein